MGSLLFGVVVLALILFAMQAFTHVNPRKLAPAIKLAGGIATLGGAAFLASRGQFGLAVPLGLTGLGLLGWLPFGPAGFFQRTQKSEGQVSRVRSAFVEMELDHDSGAMRGRILAGPHEGESLDHLEVETLASFLPTIDEESRALLMAYLDRRSPTWREHAQGDPNAGSGRGWSSGKMTEEEAYQILGVQPGA